MLNLKVAEFAKYEKGTDHSLLWKILASMAVIGLLLLYRHLAQAKYLKETVIHMTTKEQDLKFMTLAFDQAQKSYDEGGLPIGAVMVENGSVLAAGHNKRVQEGDPIAHGEMDCIRQAGRRGNYKNVILYTTLSPCMMCAGAIVQFGIKRVVIGENENFAGNIEFLESHGVEIDVLDDKRCIALMARLIQEKPRLWNEDIAAE